MQCKHAHLAIYSLFHFTATWSEDLSMIQYIEVLMHLVFLGQAKSIMELSTSYYKEEAALLGEDYDDSAEEEGGDDSDEDEGDETEENCEGEDDKDPLDYSHLEDLNMVKAKTIYIYKNREELETALAQHKPIAGVLVDDANKEDQEGSAACQQPIQHVLSYYAVFYEERRELGWLPLVFKDKEGECFCGLWYAPLIVSGSSATMKCPSTLRKLQELAKMAAVAIPRWYALGRDHDSIQREHPAFLNSYCVITNYWKERNQNGRYMLPELDAGFYPYTDPELYQRNVI